MRASIELTRTNAESQVTIQVLSESLPRFVVRFGLTSDWAVSVGLRFPVLQWANGPVSHVSKFCALRFTINGAAQTTRPRMNRKLRDKAFVLAAPISSWNHTCELSYLSSLPEGDCSVILSTKSGLLRRAWGLETCCRARAAQFEQIYATT